jgi:hypothetical protein
MTSVVIASEGFRGGVLEEQRFMAHGPEPGARAARSERVTLVTGGAHDGAAPQGWTSPARRAQHGGTPKRAWRRAPTRALEATLRSMRQVESIGARGAELADARAHEPRGAFGPRRAHEIRLEAIMACFE